MAEKSQQLDHLNAMKKRMQQTLVHLIQQSQYRLQGILKHPLICQPQTFLEWRMQKMDDFRQDIDFSLRQVILSKKHQIEAKKHQALSLKPSNQLLHLKQKIQNIEQTLKQKLLHILAQDRQQIAYKRQQLDNSWQNLQNKRLHLFNDQRLNKQFLHMVTDHARVCRERLTRVIALLKAVDPKNVLRKGYSILFAENDSFIINSIAKLTKGQQAKLLMSDGEINITINEVRSHESESH